MFVCLNPLELGTADMTHFRIEFGSGGIKKLRRKARAHLRNAIKQGGGGFNIRGGINDQLGSPPNPIVVKGMAKDAVSHVSIDPKKTRRLAREYRHSQGGDLRPPSREAYHYGIREAAHNSASESWHWDKRAKKWRGDEVKKYYDTSQRFQKRIAARHPYLPEPPTILKSRDIAGHDPHVPTRNQARSVRRILGE
jgi:hypothetical protein